MFFIQLPLALLELIIAHPFWLQGAVGMFSFAPHPSQHHHCSKWLIMELWISFIRALTGLDFKSSPENLLSNCGCQLYDCICRQRLPLRWMHLPILKIRFPKYISQVAQLICEDSSLQKIVLPNVIRRKTLS